MDKIYKLILKNKLRYLLDLTLYNKLKLNQQINFYIEDKFLIKIQTN